jgi:hypothetical protein
MSAESTLVKAPHRRQTFTDEQLEQFVAYQSNNADLLWKFGWEELTN